MRRAGPIAALALLLLLAGGCGEPEPGPPEVTEAERAYGAEQHPQLLAEFGGAYAGDQARYVAALGDRMAAAAGLEGRCTFTLVNSDVVNAFAVPGCYIYVTRGLVAVVTSEAELASVLGHELGHIVARHAQRQQRRSLWRTLGVIAVGLTGSERLTRLAGQAAQYFTLRYSRTQEYEADDLGIAALVQARYDPHAAADMLAGLGRQERFMAETGGRDEARSIPEWARSHPLTGHRIARARAAASATGLADDELPERADAYLAQVDGLLYGDDPAQGFVLGRRFAHPQMRIAFEAPPGFSLTNSPQAVGLSGPGGISGEFGGGALPPGGLDAYADLLARQLVGDMPAELLGAERRLVNGLPAIVMAIAVTAQDRRIPLALAAYDGGGGQAYHFVIASPPGDAGAGAVERLFASFRRLTAAEAAQLRPRVVRTVRVAPGQGAADLVAQVADPYPRALYELLNDRRGDAAPAPGTLVKLVRYADTR